VLQIAFTNHIATNVELLKARKQGSPAKPYSPAYASGMLFATHPPIQFSRTEIAKAEKPGWLRN
jgi:hypothetical protein